MEMEKTAGEGKLRGNHGLVMRTCARPNFLINESHQTEKPWHRGSGSNSFHGHGGQAIEFSTITTNISNKMYFNENIPSKIITVHNQTAFNKDITATKICCAKNMFWFAPQCVK